MSPRPIRVAGVVLVAATVPMFMGVGLALVAGPVGGPHRSVFVAARLLYVVGSAFALLSLPALYARQHERIGLAGMIAFALVFIGFLAAEVFPGAVQAFLLPWVYDKGTCALGCHLLDTSDGPPLMGGFFLVANLLTFLGLIIFGVLSARAAVLPSAAGYMLAVAGLLALIVTYAPVDLPIAVAQIPQALALLSVGWMGVSLATAREPLLAR